MSDATRTQPQSAPELDTNREGAEGTALAVTGTDVPSLIRLAIQEDLDVEKLERLISLQERVTDRQARTEFFAALRAFQDDCPVLHKSKTAKIATSGGGSYSYSYATLDSIARTVRPILAKHGLSYSWTTDPSSDAKVLNVVCILRHVEGHEDRSMFPVPSDTSAKMSAAQKNGAALTYGQRQSLVSVLGVTASDDVDGAEGVEPLTPDQIEELNDLVTSSGADYQRFLAYMEIDNMGDLTQGQFQDAQSALVRKATK